MQIQATLIDYQRVFKSIDGLKDIEKDKVIKEGLRAATGIYLSAGRVNLRGRLRGKKNTGNLMKAFKNKIKKNKLGALAGFNGLGMHSHLVDLGSVERAKKSGASTGKMPANNFWTDAINNNQNKAIEKVYQGIERGITKILSRN